MFTYGCILFLFYWTILPSREQHGLLEDLAINTAMLGHFFYAAVAVHTTAETFQCNDGWTISRQYLLMVIFTANGPARFSSFRAGSRCVTFTDDTFHLDHPTSVDSVKLRLIFFTWIILPPWIPSMYGIFFTAGYYQLPFTYQLLQLIFFAWIILPLWIRSNHR